ncbi:MAG TPA: 2-hydroxychromene-2-carboxylate isomerase [Gammaproteobacteria bacterium]|jgi:2-hydroxychromene-2-carboxylate isomerase|nr:2-hydroxychromene-2-carboxylate isomerase [Gammaproteobacteria bacterium]HAD35762.1 2-hydroxychromene-2-carboxylate isomerase [Gammaproteobacteria bacterium]HBK76682.1 2-hydroxychromene-2-carboxylate isomerase [Gammaproteobacteria bacterium]HIA42454.1 2-hydroxychromene-2-carboxylate isomerase [Gammaproteobacteria bacterium]HIB07247.1 2-hydroxychromene-2-carboxylate isomerase [Gammaproteobacteria bacterium]
MKTIGYYLSVVSPWSYLGHRRFYDIARAHSAEILYLPIDSSIVFPKTGGLALKDRSLQRKRYRMQELRRWRSHLKLELNLEPKYFPTDPKLASCVVIAAIEAGHNVTELVYELMRAVWVREEDVSDPSVIKSAIERSEGNVAELLSAANQLHVQSVFSENSERAVTKGVFGVPSYVVGEEVFWGQDRLEFLDTFLNDDFA